LVAPGACELEEAVCPLFRSAALTVGCASAQASIASVNRVITNMFFIKETSKLRAVARSRLKPAQRDVLDDVDGWVCLKTREQF